MPNTDAHAAVNKRHTDRTKVGFVVFTGHPMHSSNARVLASRRHSSVTRLPRALPRRPKTVPVRIATRRYPKAIPHHGRADRRRKPIRAPWMPKSERSKASEPYLERPSMRHLVLLDAAVPIQVRHHLDRRGAMSNAKRIARPAPRRAIRVHLRREHRAAGLLAKRWNLLPDPTAHRRALQKVRLPAKGARAIDAPQIARYVRDRNASLSILERPRRQCVTSPGSW